MKWFYNMKISAKLILSFVIVAIISGVVGVIGIININKMNHYDDILYTNMTVPLSEASQLSSLFQEARVNARDLILRDNLDEIEEKYKTIEKILDEMNDYAESFQKTIVQAEVETAFQNYLKAYDNYKEDIKQVYALSLENKDDEAYTYLLENNLLTANELRDAIENIVELKVNGAKNPTSTNTKIANESVIIMIVVVIVAVLIAISLGVSVSSIISKPVRKIGEAADKIADGDLDVYIDIDTKEEIGQLAKSFNRMANNLNDLIHNINLAAEQVAAGSIQLSDSSALLSQGSTEQASTIEELTTSLEEIASQTKLNADNSNEASTLAVMAKDNAIQGNDQMKNMLKAMEEINHSSNNISKIIK
ncbi:MAG: methyl-accepting chemotaxis protein, partial [Clostridiales bacterium]|nr:methyl-accepting chemotaxis protein [Clostridiales bacterium]